MNGSGETDYSDFEYEQIQFGHGIEPDGSDSNLAYEDHIDFDPLGQAGGLDNNEVAEIVYHELHVSLEFEDADVNQSIATDGEVRGVFGANLPPNLTLDSDIGTQQFRDDTSPVEIRGGTVAQNLVDVTNDNRIFQIFNARGGPSANSSGGRSNPTENVEKYEKNWRALTGRGPVLDANDSLSINAFMTVGNCVTPTFSDVRGHIVYDIATVDDATREFAVPR
jgi:hypothetical protein